MDADEKNVAALCTLISSSICAPDKQVFYLAFIEAFAYLGDLIVDAPRTG